MTAPHAAGRNEDEEQLDEDVPQPAEGELAPRWLIGLRRSRNPRGFYRSLGNHALQFTDRGNRELVVSFDNLSSARDESIARDPWGYGFVEKNGWSQLGVMAFRPDWFRDDDLIETLQELKEQGFFQRFTSVTMIGTSMGGYAACAFASLAPGCKVIAFSPQSTLKKELVPWEDRFNSGRKADWSGNYTDAAYECGAAAKVWLVYDPHFEQDQKHIDRFSGANVHKLRARFGGHKTALILRRGEILSSIVRETVEDSLTEHRFYQYYRRIRGLPWYLNGVADMAFSRGKLGLVPRIVRHLRRNGYGYAAHKLRKKFIDMSELDAPSSESATSNTVKNFQGEPVETRSE